MNMLEYEINEYSSLDGMGLAQFRSGFPQNIVCILLVKIIKSLSQDTLYDEVLCSYLLLLCLF